MNDNMTPFVPTRDDLIGFISDTYKEINGFRPRYAWSSFTYEELDQWGRKLSDEVRTHRKEEARRQRIQRKLRRVRHLLWVEKKRTYFNPTSFTVGMVAGL